MRPARYRTVVEIWHDDPHESLPLFHLMLNGRRVAILAAEEIGIEAPPAPSPPKAEWAIAHVPKPPRKKTKPMSTAAFMRTREERWEEAGIVIKRRLHGRQMRAAVDVEATLAKLGLTRDELMNQNAPQGSALNLLKRAIAQQDIQAAKKGSK